MAQLLLGSEIAEVPFVPEVVKLPNNSMADATKSKSAFPELALAIVEAGFLLPPFVDILLDFTVMLFFACKTTTALTGRLTCSAREGESELSFSRRVVDAIFWF